MADDPANPATRDRFIMAVMAAVATESTRDGVTEIPAREVSEALMVVLAALITGTSAVRTPKALRETSEAFAHDLRTQVKHMQQAYERTGRRPFEGPPPGRS